MDLSYWEKESFFNNIDLVIIGSGLVGLHSSLRFLQLNPNKKVVIFERGSLPMGASTRNAGFACFGSISELQDDLERMGCDSVWDTVRMRWDGLKLLRRVVGDDAMDYEGKGGFEVYRDEAAFEKCYSAIKDINQQMYSSLNLRSVYKEVPLKQVKSTTPGFKYAILNKFEGQLHTGKMMCKLLDLATKKGVKIINGLEVLKIRECGNFANIEIKGGLEVKTKQVLVATNGFARTLLPDLDVKPARAQVIVTSKIKGLKLKGAYHFDRGFYFFRDINQRILLGGGRNLDFKGEETTDFGITEKIQGKLEEMLKEWIIPKVPFQIEHRWSGIMGVGSEKKPIIKNISRNVVCAVRMGGMGVAIGGMVAQLAVNELNKCK